MDNIYTKLQTVRVNVQKKGLKKSGQNQRFVYFELNDFLPTANEELQKQGLCPVFNIVTDENGIEKATLSIYDGENSITFESPTAQAVLNGGRNPIQELGAKHTYLKRYLYMNALEIAENDIVDAQELEEEKATPKQIEMLKSNYKGENMQKLLEFNGIAKIEDMPKVKASQIISKLMEKKNETHKQTQSA